RRRRTAGWSRRGPAPDRRRCGGGGNRGRRAALPAHRAHRSHCVIDTHAHLDALDDPAAAVERARASGVTRILTVGTDVAGSRRALELSEAYNGVVGILGIHPPA